MERGKKAAILTLFSPLDFIKLSHVLGERECPQQKEENPPGPPVTHWVGSSRLSLKG